MATKRKTNKRRGRYKPKKGPEANRTDSLGSAALDGDAKMAHVRELAERFEKESPIKSNQGRRTLAEGVAIATVVLDDLRARVASGSANSEDQSQVGPMLRAKMKGLELLGVTEKLKPGECRACGGTGYIDGEICEACDGKGYVDE